MRKESYTGDKFSDLVRIVGAPRAMVNDNAHTMTGKDWFKVLCVNCIDDHANEAYCQNHNFAERRGGGL